MKFLIPLVAATAISASVIPIARSSDYDYDYTNGITGVEEGKKRTASAADVIKSEYSKRAPEVKGDLYYSKRGADVKDDYDYDYNKRASTAESDYKRSV